LCFNTPRDSSTSRPSHPGYAVLRRHTAPPPLLCADRLSPRPQVARPRVVIVGGGPSGLAAADRLRDHADITVLECAPRLGGRTLSVPLATHPDVTIDLGGQWVGSRHTALCEVARDLGLSLHPQYARGKRVLQLRGVVTHYAGLVPNASVAVLLDAQALLLLVALLQAALWLSSAAACCCCGGGGRLARALDGVSVGHMVGRLMWTEGGRVLVSIVVQALFGAEAADISVLAFCRYAAASGGVEHMSEIGEGSVQCWTLRGGAQQVSTGLAARLLREGGGRHRVLLEHRVAAIKRVPAAAAGGSATLLVTCANGAALPSDHVILALPPPIAAAIAFDPPLPDHRVALMTGAVMGSIIKSIAVYDTAFWRAAGFSGEVIADTSGGGGSGGDGNRGPVFNAFDACLPHADGPLTTIRRGAAAGLPVSAPSPAGGSGGEVPALVAFINGERAREWSARRPEERKAAVLAQFAAWFGPAALSPLEYVEKDWAADAHTRGCPIASYGRGVLTHFGVHHRLREPCWPEAGGRGGVHKLHWAGTETATVSTGFIDGAVRAGWAAAAEVVAARAAEAGAEGSGAPMPPLAPAAASAPVSPVKPREADARERLMEG
jgi:monoamine oxidase